MTLLSLFFANIRLSVWEKFNYASLHLPSAANIQVIKYSHNFGSRTLNVICIFSILTPCFCVSYLQGHVVGQVKQSSVAFLLYVWAGTSAAAAKEMINTFLTSTSHLLNTLINRRLLKCAFLSSILSLQIRNTIYYIRLFLQQFK